MIILNSAENEIILYHLSSYENLGYLGKKDFYRILSLYLKFNYFYILDLSFINSC